MWSGLDRSNLSLCFSAVFFCSGEVDGEWRPSVEDSSCAETRTQLVRVQENPSDCNRATLQMSKERQPVSHHQNQTPCWEGGLVPSKASASQRKQRSVQPEAEFSECSGRRSGDLSQGALVLVLAPKPTQTGLIHSSSLILRDGPRAADGESRHWSEPDEARQNPLSTPSGDFLPTFTNQRPPCVASRNTISSDTTKER